MLKFATNKLKSLITKVDYNFQIDAGDIMFLVFLVLVFIACFIALGTLLKDARSFKTGKMLKSYIKVFLSGTILGILGLLPISKASILCFVLCFILMLLYGWWSMNKMLKKEKWSKEESFLPELLYLTTKACVVGLGFFLVFNACNADNLHTAFSYNVFAIVMPWVMIKIFERWRAIPEPIFKFWEYDSSAEKPVFEGMQKMQMEVELAPMYVPIDAPLPFSIKESVMVPLNATLGSFFQRFLMDYQGSEGAVPIHDLESRHTGEPIAWIFYVYSNDQKRQKQFLDPHLNLTRNEVKVEYTTLYAERIIKPELPESPSGITILSQS